MIQKGYVCREQKNVSLKYYLSQLWRNSNYTDKGNLAEFSQIPASNNNSVEYVGTAMKQKEIKFQSSVKFQLQINLEQVKKNLHYTGKDKFAEFSQMLEQ